MAIEKILGRVLKVLSLLIIIELSIGVSCISNIDYNHNYKSINNRGSAHNAFLVEKERFYIMLDIVSNSCENVDSIQLDYIIKYAPLAWQDYQKYKFPVSIKIAQFILESGVSETYPEGSKIFRVGNNGFGLKYFGNRYLKRIPNYKKYITSQKYILGRDDCPVYCRFIDFKTIEDSFRYHTIFMVGTNNKPSHYMNYISNGDASNWMYALNKGGYATSDSYVESLSNIIKKYNLNLLDT